MSYSRAFFPTGGEFNVASGGRPSYTDVIEPITSMVTALSSGGFVFNWIADFNGAGRLTYGQSGYAQRFGADGSATAASLFLPPGPVAVLSDDSFIVADYNKFGTLPSRDAFAQRYTADGVAVGEKFRINADRDGDQYPILTRALPGGGFAIAWASTLDDSDYGPARDYDIYLRRYAADGTATTGEVRVNTTTAGNQRGGDMAVLSDGGLLVAWTSDGQDGSGTGIYAQRFAADGATVGGEFRVNTATAGAQDDPVTAALSDGGFVVAWASAEQDGSGAGVYAQRFAADGTAAGQEFRVNSFTAGAQNDPALTALPGGGFVVAWTSEGQDGSGTGIYAQHFGADGAAIGPEFRVNAATAGDQGLSALAALTNGSLVVSWTTIGPSGDDNTIQARRFDLASRDAGPLVDDAFYYTRYPDVAAALIDPDLHYAAFGAAEGRDPNAFFSAAGYRAAYPDVVAAGLDALDHYARYGWREGRDPSAAFDTQAYLARYPDVAAAGMDPLAHFLRFGQAEGREATPAVGKTVTASGFDAEFYLLANPDVAAAGADALDHYGRYGWREGREGRDPNGVFDASAYLLANPDVARAGAEPLRHYLDHGWREGRSAGPLFDAEGYLAANPDVLASGMNPLAHFLLSGSREGRDPTPEMLG